MMFFSAKLRLVSETWSHHRLFNVSSDLLVAVDALTDMLTLRDLKCQSLFNPDEIDSRFIY